MKAYVSFIHFDEAAHEVANASVHDHPVADARDWRAREPNVEAISRSFDSKISPIGEIHQWCSVGFHLAAL